MTASLMLRAHGTIETIATHGIWLMDYSKTARNAYVPRMERNFSFETRNIQNDLRFRDSEFVKENPRWKYAAMVMISHHYSDQFDIELWCSDGNELPEDGSIILQMQKTAIIISDAFSLIIQIWEILQKNIENDNKTIKNVLKIGIVQSSFCAALVDGNLNILAASPALARYQMDIGGPAFVEGQSMTDFWIDGASALQVSATMATGKPTLGQYTRPQGGDRSVQFDFMSSRFSGGAAHFALFTVRQALFAAPETRPDLLILNDSARDQAEDGPKPVSQFLLSTLVRNTRLSRRKGQAYVSTRSWRKPIKEHQLAALKALKADPPAHLVETVASELADVVRNVYGEGVARYVVPVPCGHSCGRCFSTLVAQVVAEKLGLEFVEAFERQTLQGSSHPKTNVRRPKMKIQRTITGPAILIDDVATSGSHIEEARKLLHKTTDTVWPVVWIAD